MEAHMKAHHSLFARLLFIASAACCSVALAQDLNQKEGDFVTRDFAFQSGESLPELRIHYVTLGTPVRDAAGQVKNAVLLLHGTAGNRTGILNNFSKELFGKGQPLDAEKYYLVVPDAIGHGASSKPSDGMRSKFPHYGYYDMVEAQHRLVTDGLGVNHLRLVMGVSMGGMQTWLWGEKFADMMDALMPINSQPVAVAGHNLIWRRVITEAIRNDPDWNGGMYARPPMRWQSVLPLFTMMLGNRARIYADAPNRLKSNELFNSIVENGRKMYDANDFLYAFEASWDYDPAPDLEKIKGRLLVLNFADDMINAAELGTVDQAVAKVANARAVTIVASSKNFGHLNQLHPDIWKSHLSDLLSSLQ
jgi:homoserine O-acetyltransferase/O-succinyltransferase